MGDNIKVSVRLRNLIEREIQSKAVIYWVAKDKTTVTQNNNNSATFSYDRVFAGNESNEVVYSEFCSPIVESVISGFNGTIFAYGQTSSGKTHTLMGDERFDLGIAHHTVCDIFEHIQNMADREFLLRVSFMEIYNNEKVIDLLAKKSDENLKLQDDQYGNVKVLNLTESVVQEPDQVLELLRKGQRRRKTGETVLNQKSSRSHLIFRMIIESRLRGDENAAVNVSHFNIVDLAGSEKPSENASGARFKEGVNINTSLLMLSQVIYQLSAEKESQFINYRASKLTRILKNSLGGNALTAIICTITPASYDETLSTLKFALNAKKIKNKPRVIEIETEETLIKSYANKIKKLTKLLEATKEEKNQEAKKRQDMQEQIETLKKKFVQFVPQNNITRATRRETWGGCLDLARMKNHFQPSRPLKLAVVDEENEMTSDGLEIDKTFNDDFFRSRKSTISNRMSSVSSFYSMDSTVDEFSKKEDVAIGKLWHPCSKLKDSENKILKLYEEKVADLEKELHDLKHFTTLEKQMFADQNSETKVMGKSLSQSAFSPGLEKSKKSDVNNLSVGEESFGIINSLVNRKSEANRNVIDLDQEIFCQNLNIIIEKLSSILDTEALSPSIPNPYFKVIYQLANVIFQKHFIGSNILIDEQVKEMFTLLTKIFVGFSDQEDSTGQNSDLIIQFDEMSEKLLKDIENTLEKSEDSSNAANCFEIENVNNVINVSHSESPTANLITKTFNEKESEVNSTSLSICQCKSQIPLLEETINNHLETINHLQNNHDLVKKQLTLSEDKIKIQEQVITSLQNEIDLKIKCCAKLVDNFTQTSYMAHLKNSRDSLSLPQEMPSSVECGTKAREMMCSNCLKSRDYLAERNASDPSLSVIKSELCDIRLLTQKMMDDSMPKAYYSDININEPSETLAETSVDSLKTEIAMLKKMLHKIKFYLKDRSEWSKQLENEMVDKMSEISSLQKQYSSTEMALQEKKNQLDKLNADLCQFRKEVSERRRSIRTMSVELTCLDHDDIRSVGDIIYLKRVMNSFADAVEDRHSALTELRQKHTSQESKITQTVENYPDLAALEEVRAHEFRERAHLCQENASMKLKVKELIEKVEDLEQDLESKENNISEIQQCYEKEIEQHLSRHRELERSCKETMQKHIKDIEHKYEEELQNQEKSFFDMMDEKLKSLREEIKSEREKKQKELKEFEDHYERLISQHNAKCRDLQSKLTEEMNYHEESKLKLQTEIRDFKNREEIAKQAYYKLKDKFKEYVQGVKNMRMNNAKYVKEKETQTNSENNSSEICNECRTSKQDQKELKTQTALKSSKMALLESENRNMVREIAALKRDLSAKSALLLTCNCRLFARPQDMVREVPHKTKISDVAEVNQEPDQLKKMAALDSKEVLKLDIVQKAINEARESERAIFNSGEGPASQEMCLLLQRKLAKKEKEISDMKNIISQRQFKVAPSDKLNSENIPMHPIDAEVLNNFTPCVQTGKKHGDDAVLKVHPKKVLNEVNKPQNVEAPRNKWFMTEEESEKAKEIDENLRKFRREPECKQQ